MQNVQSIIRAFENTFILKVLFAVGLIFACSQITIPLLYVPVTLQTIAIILIGLTYTPREAFASVGLYLSLGAMGLPMFASFSSGMGILTGTTAGYLTGFLVAAPAMAFMKDKFFKKDNWLTAGLNSIIGMTIIFFLGISWLSYLIGFEAAIVHGLLPFILPGLLKNAMTVTLLFTLKPIWFKLSNKNDKDTI